MSVRNTSADAYRSIAPTLSEKQAVVLGLLQRSSPMSNSEIGRALGWEINRVTPRVKELREAGKVFEMGKRTCRVTGMTVLMWGVPARTLFDVHNSTGAGSLAA